MNIIKHDFGQIHGQPVIAHTIMNDNGMKMTAINYGCIITELSVPDRNGFIENIVLGFDTLEEYEKDSPYFGAIVGRHAGRIKEGNFELDGVYYQLERNNGENHLHGGVCGLDRVVWDIEVKESEKDISLKYSYYSKDGENGYPGNVHLKVSYTLNEDNVLILKYEGDSDKRTILNLTNHSYFNLSGNLKRSIEDHHLILKSDRFIELNEDLIPTGVMLETAGTAFDFRNGRMIHEGIKSDHQQNIIAGNGYDHPFLLSENNNEEIILKDSESGRVLVIETNQPCVVLYTGTQLNDEFSIRRVKSQKYLGLCLETQGLPDAIHHPNFPVTVLNSGEKYLSITKMTFKVQESDHQKI
ncbi:aldose epimerase family protein [Bacillus sp. JJ1122]|uniref:aldose epimerase family protein n=1 Tax=Bacillus sp. JJ1122 TaxID=3122951 RepID=UPI002FFF0F42